MNKKTQPATDIWLPLMLILFLTAVDPVTRLCVESSTARQPRGHPTGVSF